MSSAASVNAVWYTSLDWGPARFARPVARSLRSAGGPFPRPHKLTVQPVMIDYGLFEGAVGFLLPLRGQEAAQAFPIFQDAAMHVGKAPTRTLHRLELATHRHVLG